MKPRLEGATCARIRAVLSEGAATAHELAARVHACLAATRRNLRALHEANEIHIKGWSRDFNTGPSRAVWAIGDGKDARPPKPASSTIRQRRRRRDPEVQINELMAKRKKRALPRTQQAQAHA